MIKMTTHERFTRMFEHKEADRVVMWDFPWPGALRRWQSEGMPTDVSYEDYFGVDKVGRVIVDNSPLYTERIVEETDESITFTTKWGGIQRDFKLQDSTPEFIEFSITDPEKWLVAKELIVATPDRIPWDYLKNHYPLWRGEGRWILGDLFFGFDNIHSYVVGTERVLIALVENPDWISDMCNHCLDVNLKLLDMAWDAGYTFDMLNIRDDMGYKYAQFFSLDTYRELIKPQHKKAADWAHRKGIRTRLHSCGCITPFIPDIIDAGIDALHPLEVKAGIDPAEVKRKYGDALVLHGGFNALLWNDLDAIRFEIERLLPIMKQGGGYIFAADHSIPNDVSFKNMKEIIRLAKELGKY